MEPATVFSSKAEKYARYRWDYAPEAVQAIFSMTGVSGQSTVADIGAGTGILTRHFLDRVKMVYAVEPNAEMRALARQVLGDDPACQIIDAQAEATGLPGASVDLVTAAQATNWFEPSAARAEFLRILKPDGWLALLRNYGTNAALNEALEAVYPPETDTAEIMPGRGVPRSFYFGGEEYLKLTFEFTTRETWEEFIGALSSASFAPDEGTPLYPGFERAARGVFERFRAGDVLVSSALTELCLGQMRP